MRKRKVAQPTQLVEPIYINHSKNSQKQSNTSSQSPSHDLNNINKKNSIGVFSPYEVHMVELLYVLWVDKMFEIWSKVQVHVCRIGQPVLRPSEQRDWCENFCDVIWWWYFLKWHVSFMRNPFIWNTRLQRPERQEIDRALPSRLNKTVKQKIGNFLKICCVYYRKGEN